MRSRPRRNSGERSGPMAELMLDEGAQLAEGLVVFGNQEQRIIAETRLARGARGSIVRGRHPRLRGGSFRKGSASARAQRNAAPRRSSGVSASASRTLRLLASSFVGSPAYLAEKTPGARPVRRPSGPNRRRPPRPPAPGPAPTPSCGRCRRTCRHPRSTSGAAAKSSTERIKSRPSDRLGSQGGAMSSAISLHFLRLREPRTSITGRVFESDGAMATSCRRDRVQSLRNKMLGRNRPSLGDTSPTVGDGLF